MKKSKTIILLSISAIMLFSLSACMKTRQARDVDAKPVLVDRSLLKDGGDGEALKRYVNPKTDFKKYAKIIIDPVMVFKPKDATEKEITDLKNLSSNAHSYFVRELGKDYKIVKDAGPDVLKLQTAILDAETSNPFTDTVSSILPFGVAFSVVKDFATGKPTGVGEITGELKLSDSVTGEVVGAALDRRVGGKGMGGVFESWNDANAGMEFWAKRSRFALCEARKGTNCEKPDNY